MPSIDQLALQAGYTKPDNAPSLSQLVEEADELKGLKDSNYKLKGEKEKVESEFKSLIAEKEQAYEELAKKHNDSEKLAEIKEKKAREEREAYDKKLQDALDALNSEKEGRKMTAQEAGIAEVSALFGGSKFGKLLAKETVVTDFDESGAIKKVYKFGDETFSSLDEWKSAAIKDAEIASMMPIGGEHKGPAVGGNGQGGGQPAEQKPKLSAASQGYLANI